MSVIAAILAALQAIPALGKIFEGLMTMFHEWQLSQLKARVLQDGNDIRAALKLKDAEAAMTIEEARERARKLNEIFAH